MKAIEKAKSPNPANPPSRIAEPSARRRKISVGPIDFEQRREHIRLAYTKSIRETQAHEARQKAKERRRKEMEAAAKATVTTTGGGATAAAGAVSSTPDLGTARPAEDSDGPSVSDTADSPPVPQIPILHQSQDVPEIYAAKEVHNALNLLDSPSLSPDTEGNLEPEQRGFAHDDRPSPVLEDLEDDYLAADVAAALPPGTFVPVSFGPETPSINQDLDSPTLGVPGSFPPLSPPSDVVERPQTAASTRTETTEFDNEPQESPLVRVQTPSEIPITIVEPPSAQTTRSEYQDPFQNEPDSPGRPEPGRDAVQESHEPGYGHDNNEPEIPDAFVKEPEGDQSVQPEDQSYLETTITILPPKEDAESAAHSRQTVPFPRLEHDYESDYQPEAEHGLDGSHYHYQDQGETTDASAEATDDHHRLDECRRESQFDNQVPSHGSFTCESVDVDNDEYSSYQHERPDSTTNLMVPTFSATNRASQQSTWTDFSVDSGDVSPATRSPVFPDASNDDNEDDTASHGHATIYETRSIHRESRPTSRPFESRHSQTESRPISGETSRSSHPSHQLPELDTGDGFSVPYLSQKASKSFSYFPSPNHEPPPVPASASGSACNSQRASAVYYEQSHSTSTFVNSERGSEDYLPSMTTPQSMDASSLGKEDQYFAGATPINGDTKPDAQDKTGPTGKEKHRLVQRRNVIKELVDTEAVFVRDMNIVEEIYRGTAEACPKLDTNTTKLIFRNTDEIISFHTAFLQQIKETCSAVYAMQGRRSALAKEGSFMSEPTPVNPADIDDAKDRSVAIGPVFKANMEKMKLAHEGFLRNSDQAAKRLIQIQQDPTVKVWLNECNEVAKDLTAAWDLDSLLIKPMQRITKYPNLIITLLQHTPQDHPDREDLLEAKDILETAIIEINKTKKNFELVGQIVGRKRKESDVKAGFARAFGKRVDKLQASGARASEDTEYAKLDEKFGDDYLRLQVVLRDVEFYTRQVSAYVHEFLQYISSIELVMRLQPGNYPELESKWVQFNISIRDLEKVALEDHVSN